MAQQPFSKMYDVEVVGGDQRQRLAEMLRANALNAPQGQMVSGWYVPPSWSQNLAHLANTAVGVFGGIAAEDAEREAEARDIEKMKSARIGDAVRNYGKPPATSFDQAAEAQYPSTPAAGTVQDGQFKLMNTGGTGMPSYGTTQQPRVQQPQFDITDPRQFESRMGRNFARQNMMQQFAAPEWSTDVKYDQQGRAYVTNKQGDFKYIGSENAPIRKADYNELIRIDPVTGKETINPLYVQGKSVISRAGAANVNVNTGQKGFDNTLKLRGDFRSEPVYKGFQEVQAAWDQIRETSKNATPANDLATATKMMKILDPNSVVRESELALALTATGLEDRLTNYVNMLRTGQKLNPAQRKDFSNMAETLYNEAALRYNQKRNEYASIAERNQLDIPSVVGSEAKINKKVIRTGKMGGRKVVEYNDGTVEYAE